MPSKPQNIHSDIYSSILWGDAIPRLMARVVNCLARTACMTHQLQRRWWASCSLFTAWFTRAVGAGPPH
jgi:hypothetical protein